MLFKEYTYSVLLVSSFETAKNVGKARRKLLERGYDIVLINTPLSDDFGTKLALDVVADSKSSVLLFVKNDMYEEITDKVIDFGVFTLSKPTSSMVVRQLLQNMYAMQERFRRMEKKAATLEEKMEEIRVVNHAKWILIQNMQLTEAEAHKLIEKQAMDTRQTKREVAEGIVKTYEN